MRVNSGIVLINAEPFTTKNFKQNIYLGSPGNALRILSDLAYDELVVLNVDSTLTDHFFCTLQSIAIGCRKPLIYSGQISNETEALRVIACGYERIGIQTLVTHENNRLSDLSSLVGKQSVTLFLDILTEKSGEILHKSGRNLQALLTELLANGTLQNIGEILLNNITLNGSYNQEQPWNELANICSLVSDQVNIGYCGGISEGREISKLENIGFDSVVIMSAASLDHSKNTKLLNEHAVGEYRKAAQRN